MISYNMIQEDQKKTLIMVAPDLNGTFCDLIILRESITDKVWHGQTAGTSHRCNQCIV
jgi:hypothetical protein